MQYPLDLQFKLVAINPQVTVTDAAGYLARYVKQKAFKLKEAVTVFADREMTRPLFTFQADRVIDFRATYHIADAAGNPFGSIRREGMRSIWKTRYEVTDASGQVAFRIQEDNPWVKVGDAFFSEIPILGMFAGYVFHPSYTLSYADGRPALKLKKVPSMVERRFRLEELSDVSEKGEVLGVLAVLMMTLIERARG